ncbi:MAG: RNase H1/viroplasmin domain-containing protein [Pseudohongiella sp.]|nr:RNase H1/viroplasmin domain-containing protein [Pseudohongiella sp.]
MTNKYFVVSVGRQKGLHTTMASLHKSISKYPGAEYQSYATRAEANQAEQERCITNTGEPFDRLALRQRQVHFNGYTTVLSNNTRMGRQN